MRKRNEKKSILNGRRRQDMQRKRRKHDTYIERVKNEMIEDFLKGWRKTENYEKDRVSERKTKKGK